MKKNAKELSNEIEQYITELKSNKIKEGVFIEYCLEEKVPETKEPDKWEKNIALSKSDFQTNVAGGEDINDFAKRIGAKAKFNFYDGKAINLETGEVVTL